ncbi:TetR/AcrR family transcriptional regulator [Rubeoparvulum massiliense]|uniref:TetR/AcrR family transcriptional regulator n=1 Tax=Rubeoparvulum massiliense TaxID=1631346 RepID=UPI00065DD992|nr:TetR/AcrR family transcriptional regulator [Rubeoparvulum massiliense]
MKKEIPSMVKDWQLIKKRREQLIEAAVQLMIVKGYHGTTTREIARAAGFSIGTLYEYIETKEDVLYLVCEHIHADVEEQLQAIISDIPAGKAGLEQAIRQFITMMDQMSDQVLLIYQESKALPKEMLRYVLAKELCITKIFETFIQRVAMEGSLPITAETIPLMAHNIVVLGQMWAFRRWALRKQYSLESYIQEQTHFLIRSILVQEVD